eukprot:COSAG04_NODE_15293_length_536_cov_1.748284_2_plen_22_part_01
MQMTARERAGRLAYDADMNQKA